MPDSSSASRPWRFVVLFALVVGCAGLELLTLHQRWPFLVEIEAWIWPLHDEPRAGSFWPWLLGLGAASTLVVALRARSATLALALLVAGSVLWQWGLASMEGPGLEPLEQRFLHSGHGEIARGVLELRDPAAVVRNYEDWINVGLLGPNVVTKPPGHLLLYHLMEKRSRRDLARPTDEARLEALGRLAARLLPFLAALALLPLYMLGRIGWDDETARVGAALYAVTPAAALVVMHFDQALFPTLALCLLVLSWSVGRFGSLFVAVVAGAFAWATLFVTFALLGLAPVCLAVGLLGVARSDRRRRGLVAGLVALGALAACHLLAVEVLGYDALTRFERAMTVHATWKAGFAEIEGYTTLTWLGLNLLDWSYWLGWAPAGLVLVALITAPFGRTFGARFAAALSIGLALALVPLGASSSTTGETGRLWIFLMPAAALVSGWVVRQVRGRLGWALVAVLLGGQVALTLVMKIRADF